MMLKFLCPLHLCIEAKGLSSKAMEFLVCIIYWRNIAPPGDTFSVSIVMSKELASVFNALGVRTGCNLACKCS